MKAKISLILLVAACLLQPRITAQNGMIPTLPPRDLTLLDQRTKRLGSEQIVLEVGEVKMDFPEAMLRTNRPALHFGGAGQAPVICEIRVPCRVVIKSSEPGQKMRLYANDSTFAGGVKVEVFVGERPAFDLTAAEVKVEQ